MRCHTKIHDKIGDFQREVSANVVQSEGLREVITFDKTPISFDIMLLVEREVLLLIREDPSVIV
jgi:hypothetical protein